MKTFLFQGDSITDFGRNRDDESSLGLSFPLLVGAELSYRYPGQYKFINKGISGDRSVDIYQRIKIDLINLKPDYLTLLFGINDLWHEYAFQNGVSAKKFEMIYSLIIEEIKEALPDTKIMVLEPFVLSGTATDQYQDRYKAEIGERCEIVKKIAEKYDLFFIPLKKEFDELAEKTGDPSIWLYDGAHPNLAGRQFIANKVIEAFEKIK